MKPALAMAVLNLAGADHSNPHRKAKLFELEQQKKEAEFQNIVGEKKDIAWGSQIRSYVFQPYQMVKDHRTNHESGNVSAVMDGDLDPFIEAYLTKQSS